MFQKISQGRRYNRLYECVVSTCAKEKSRWYCVAYPVQILAAMGCVDKPLPALYKKSL